MSLPGRVVESRHAVLVGRAQILGDLEHVLHKIYVAKTGCEEQRRATTPVLQVHIRTLCNKILANSNEVGICSSHDNCGEHAPPITGTGKAGIDVCTTDKGSLQLCHVTFLHRIAVSHVLSILDLSCAWHWGSLLKCPCCCRCGSHDWRCRCSSHGWHSGSSSLCSCPCCWGSPSCCLSLPLRSRQHSSRSCEHREQHQP
mmetsp:Transcript_55749/g.90203  ORF Transcript_55749/g.90203 Transcript_55749/m.90203 type:complete len:200 (+) Transcript_55749:344-943(+)